MRLLMGEELCFNSFFDINFWIFLIYSYGDTSTLNRNNLSMAHNNTFSTLGRTRPQHNNYSNNNMNSTLNRNHRYHADLPITNPIFKRWNFHPKIIQKFNEFFSIRHQSSEMLNCESNDNVYFGGNKRAIDHYAHLGFPYNIDRSEQETTTEL